MHPRPAAGTERGLEVYSSGHAALPAIVAEGRAGVDAPLERQDLGLCLRRLTCAIQFRGQGTGHLASIAGRLPLTRQARSPLSFSTGCWTMPNLPPLATSLPLL